MIISKQAFDSFEAVKSILDTERIKLSTIEFLQVQEVYSEITGKPLSDGCSGCIITGLKILRNWRDKFYQDTLSQYSVKVQEIASDEVKTKRKYSRKK